MIVPIVPDMVLFVLTGEDDFVGRNRTKSNIKWFRQGLPGGPRIDLLRKEIPRDCHKHVHVNQGEWNITLSSTGFHFVDEYGEGGIVRPVDFTPAFQQNAGWVDNLTIKLPRCILTDEKTTRSGHLPDDKPIVHVFSGDDFFSPKSHTSV
jgi:hypothetical protein